MVNRVFIICINIWAVMKVLKHLQADIIHLMHINMEIIIITTITIIIIHPRQRTLNLFSIMDWEFRHTNFHWMQEHKKQRNKFILMMHVKVAAKENMTQLHIMVYRDHKYRPILSVLKHLSLRVVQAQKLNKHPILASVLVVVYVKKKFLSLIIFIYLLFSITI